MAGSALPKEDQHFTYADYKSWELAPGERFEVIYGEAYAMAAPRPINALSAIRKRAVRRIENRNR
jgi:hypothetical protein